VYGQVCKTCHETGLAGAHKFGDTAGWAKVVAQGPDTSFQHALAGIRAMPARGGNADLTDDEVKRGVVYMVNHAGASWKEPPPTAETALAAATERTGQQVVDAVCSKCHATGEYGSPKIGDRAAWIQRLKLGLQPVYQSALKGHSGMPARGGMADLSDAEVKRAVEYMMNSGAAASVVAAAPAATQAPAAAAPAAVDGKKVYDGVCMVCHAAGVAGAPKFGDRAAWAPRLKTGMDALYASALKGKNAMPAKGGNAALSDADVKAAVDFMTAAAK
jgi:cytochrome c5